MSPHQEGIRKLFSNMTALSFDLDLEGKSVKLFYTVTLELSSLLHLPVQ